MQSMNETTRPYLRFFVKSLPTTAIAGIAFIAINHAPTTETYRVFLAGTIAILIELNSWYGPRMGDEIARLNRGCKSVQPE